ncbi:MAG: hypothetical protein GF311_14570 [Candidatus Lokiarchaeota archaeon]|nr:hypothetical protein [Candidatus Lokiarchaeota archaeon]
MTPKRYLSKKKTAKQTISISPELKAGIEKIRHRKKRENPGDERYKSISSFYTTIMEQMLQFLETGNKIQDLYKYPDSNLKDFFENFSFKGVAPVYEPFLESNRYSSLDLKSVSFFLLSVRNTYLEDLNPYDLNDLKKFFQKIRKYFIRKNIARNFKFTLKTQNGEKNFQVIFEFSSYFKNFTFENAKYNALLFGFMGTKLNKIRFSDDGTYIRMEVETTELFFNPKSHRIKRMKLAEQNLKKLINFKLILVDQKFYTWSKLSIDKDVLISFKNFSELEDLLKKMGLNSIQNELMEDIDLKRLQFFEKLHWIKINNKEEKSFSIVMPEADNQDEIEYMFRFLQQFSKVVEMGKNNYYLE